MPTDDLKASGDPATGHQYLLNVGELVRYLAWTVVTFSVLMILVWALVRSELLPKEAYLSNPDSAIISTKALMASRSPGKSIAFVGDSSCLINIDIPTLKNYLKFEYEGEIIDNFGDDSNFLKENPAKILMEMTKNDMEDTD